MTLTVYRNDGSPKAANTQVVGDAPVGSLLAYAGAAVPSDWMACDGRAIARVAYPDLYNAIGTTWGAGDGSTTFNLPDLRGATIIGAGTGSGLTARTLAQKGGEEKHTLTIAELAAHTHPPANASYQFAETLFNASQMTPTGTSFAAIANADPTTGVAGSGTPHNTMPPFAVANWIIRVFPPYKTANLVAPTGAQRVTALPTYPVDGQEIHYVADAANGVLWHLRYNAAGGAYPWEFVGGSSLSSEIEPSETIASGVVYVDLATVGPLVTAPLSGDYWVDFGAWANPGIQAPNYTIWATVKEGTAVASDTKALVWQKYTATSSYGPSFGGQSRGKRVNGITANAPLTMQYKQSANFGAAMAFQNRWMAVRPVRVG